ncbi:hypothetical protein [Actinospongicola halichondriae]|uniref:hypothetical protein n=1 Tax=Actinospongicola halichondriae TaxID=3236844 RepID=UPI003D5AC52A
MSGMSAHGGRARYEDLCVQLENVGEALTDRSIDILQSALEAGAPEHPGEEKQLAKAQRAVGKALQILRALDESG